MGWFSPGGLLKKAAGFAANPILGSGMVAKDILGGVNDIMGRGYNKASGYQDQIYDLYDNNKSNINEIYDPKLRKAQVSGLDRLMGISKNKGLDAQSKSILNKIRKQEGQIEKGSRDAIMMNAAERGASSSTGSLLDQLTNAQSASERRTNQDTDVFAGQQKRALDALYGSINTAGSINDQDMRRAGALDLFNRYNLSGKAGVLGNKGQIAQEKAGAENDFWGNIIGAGASMMAGAPPGAGGMLGGGGGGKPASMYTSQLPSPWESYYGGGWST